MPQQINITLEIPEQLEMLSQLFNFKIERFLQEFIYDVSLDVKSMGSTERMTATDYFLNRFFNTDYTYDDKAQMLEELNYIRSEYTTCPEDEYEDLRQQFLDRWFKEWQDQAIEQSSHLGNIHPRPDRGIEPSF